MQMMALPQDVTRIEQRQLLELCRQHPRPWLFVAGFECQDMSSAGNGQGLAGPRSGTNLHMLRVMSQLSEELPAGAFGYAVENTAAQHNWKHDIVRNSDFPKICADLGMPVCMDAARFGARSHRVRNVWSNLAPMQLT